MVLTPGMRLGPYEIQSALGAGGMGEVYRARDTRLQRDVAIKVLPEQFALDADRLARFRREAQVLASLNHPNIAAIYGLEEAEVVVSGFSRTVQALVLEFVDGPTLADRIARGPIPRDEALPIARQIADALEAAHEQGIIHRDLKPANIKVRPDGTVKVLDFGLAKALETAPEMELSQAPTITSPAMTGMGVIMGTAAYMSPEQAKGKPLDKRTDIWAFGSVLYEMVTGRRAFGGEDVGDTLAFIITKEPEWTALPADAPHAIRRLLRRCLEKDRKRRLADIADARLEFDERDADPALDRGGEAPRTTTGHRRLLLGAAAFIAIASAAAVTGVIITRESVADGVPVYRSTLLLPPGVTLVPPGGGDRVLAIAPDGRRVAFSAVGEGGRRLLWARRLDTLVAEPLLGSDNGQSPFWSPDSRWIGFFADGQLKKVEADGGPVLTVCRYTGNGGGATWNRDGIILFSDAVALHRVPAAGGTPSLVMTPDPQAGATNYQWPFFLPDGRQFIYRGAASATYLASLDSPEGKLLGGGAGNAQYAQGHLVWLAGGGTLVAQPLDLSRLELTNEPIAIAEQVPNTFSLSQSGVILYQNVETSDAQLVWFDRSGKQISVLGDRGDFGDVELSPDGTQAAVSVLDPGQRTRDIWILDIARGVRSKFTFDAANDVAPVWSPDGRRIVFNSSRESIPGAADIYEKALDASAETPLIAANGSQRALSWSPDGRLLLYQDQFRLFALPLMGDRKPFQVLDTVTPANLHARFSPDGRWIAYTSSESGRDEVYVTRFPTPGGKWLVSTGGGTWARWRADGKELFYQDLNGMLMSVEVEAQETGLRVGAVRPLFQMRTTSDIRGGYFYDVSADGQRFLVNVSDDDPAAAPLTLVLNWPALVRQ